MGKQPATVVRSLAMVVLALLALGACAPRGGGEQDRHDGFYGGVSAGAVLH